MKSIYFKKLSELNERFRNCGFMCYYECFMMDFTNNYLPFDDKTQFLFPVLKGTKYSDGNAITLEIAEALGELSKIEEPFENEYNKKLQHLLNLSLSTDLFKEHSLFLLKEHCKLFSPYSDKAKELLKKLEELK